MDAARLQELMDREAIRDCLYGYCRGIDRADEQALRAAYWPDAHDRHGAYDGPVDGFIAHALEIFKTGPRNIHHVTNVLIAFANARTASVESAFLAFQRGRDAGGTERQVMLAGRYCDRFEKRGEEWRVADRVVVYDWVDEQTPPAAGEAERFGPRRPIGAARPHDPVYALLAGAERTS